MSNETVTKNHIGLAIDAQIVDDDTGVAIDVSSASTKQLKIQGPGQTTKTKTAAFIDDGTDGWVRYTTIDGDLDVIGVWQIQGSFVDSGETYHTLIDTFTVIDTL